MDTRVSGQPFATVADVQNFTGTPDVSDACILVVDDIELNRLLIQVHLIEEGFRQIHFAVDGADALDKIKRLHPDLVILDLLMPKVDGFEVLERLSDMSLPHSPAVIVQTALSEQDERVRVFEMGATDLVTKPITPVELKARTRLHLENRFLLHGLRSYHERLNRDLLLARQMQEGLLPTAHQLDIIEARYGVRLQHAYVSSDELGGDFWGVQEIDDDRLFFHITDFAGHGITAALNTFRLHSTLMQQDHSMKSPANYLAQLNKHLCRLLNPGQFATMLCGVIDIRQNSITYASAASTTPLLGQLSTGNIQCGDPSGVPLGVIEDAVYEDRSLPFLPGHMLFLYSDALTESPDKDGVALMDEGLQSLMTNALRSQDGRNGKVEFLDDLMAAFDARVPRPLPDDLTAVSFQRL